MAGVGGFEPPNAGIKNQCLTAWLYPNRKKTIFLRKILQAAFYNFWEAMVYLMHYWGDLKRFAFTAPAPDPGKILPQQVISISFYCNFKCISFEWQLLMGV